MSTATHYASTQRKLSFFEHLAFSIIAYAAANPARTAPICATINRFATVKNGQGDTSNMRIPTTRFLTIPDDMTAFERLEWVMRYGNQPSRSVLTHYAQSYLREHPQPKQVVIGITVGVIPGLTLGKMIKRKVMRLIIREDIAARRDAIGRYTAHTTGSLLARAVEEAGGNAYRMEPSLTEWLFGERTTSLHTASAETLSTLHADLINENIPIGSTSDESGLAAIAIHPVVSDNLTDSYPIDDLVE